VSHFFCSRHFSIHRNSSALARLGDLSLCLTCRPVCALFSQNKTKQTVINEQVTTMAAKSICVTTVTILVVIALMNVGYFVTNESSPDLNKNDSRSLRTSTKLKLALMLEKLGKDGKATAKEKVTNDSCVATPNRTVIQKEDLELSCIEFRRETRPTIEEAFAHLGEEAIKDAEKLRKLIKEQGKNVRIAIGSGPNPTNVEFIPTDYPVVDICNATRLSALLEESSVEAMIASHVWEHFTYSQAIQALQNVQCLLVDNAIARFGVPDAQHPDKVYHDKKAREGFPERVFKADYRNSAYPGHRALWTEDKFATAASMAGLNARPLEWWSAGSIDERKFCYTDYNGDENGKILRSLKEDSRNTKENPYAYTSLIVDLSPQVLV